MCIHINCKKQSIYNLEGETKGLYCFRHKKEGMIDVKNKKCNEEGCKTRPNYNLE
jgi:hypothetical protein